MVTNKSQFLNYSRLPQYRPSVNHLPPLLILKSQIYFFLVIHAITPPYRRFSNTTVFFASPRVAVLGYILQLYYIIDYYVPYAMFTHVLNWSPRKLKPYFQGCGFFGSSTFDGMCSKCFKDNLKRKSAQQNSEHGVPSAAPIAQPEPVKEVIKEPEPGELYMILVCKVDVKSMF